MFLYSLVRLLSLLHEGLISNCLCSYWWLCLYMLLLILQKIGTSNSIKNTVIASFFHMCRKQDDQLMQMLFLLKNCRKCVKTFFIFLQLLLMLWNQWVQIHSQHTLRFTVQSVIYIWQKSCFTNSSRKTSVCLYVSLDGVNTTVWWDTGIPSKWSLTVPPHPLPSPEVCTWLTRCLFCCYRPASSLKFHRGCSFLCSTGIVALPFGMPCSRTFHLCHEFFVPVHRSHSGKKARRTGWGFCRWLWSKK